MLAAGLGLAMNYSNIGSDSVRLTAFWLILYGGALHAAGFLCRGGSSCWAGCMCLLGFIMFFSRRLTPSINENAVHWLMGLSFGIINLTYGVYLKLTLDSMETE